jgi:Protein of unknown function (DUF3073)
MGRGRAKAKQVKVARQLKYNSGGTDLDRLRAELGVVTDQQDAESEAAYAELGDRYSDDDDDNDDDDDDDDDDEDDLDDGLVDMSMPDEAPRRTGNASARMSRTSGT